MSVPEPAFLQFRNAVPADEALLREMLYLAIYVPPGQPPLPRSVLDDPAIARYVEAWGSHPSDRGLIAMGNGVAVGAAWLRRFPAASPGYGFVEESIPELSIAVLPEYQRQGIGSRLIAELLRDTPAVSLSCDPVNPAWKLYLRFGFRPLADGRTMLMRRNCR